MCYNSLMKFASSYEPGEFEADIYAAWEASKAFQPKIAQYDGKETDTRNAYSIVMPPPNANGNLHIGHGLTIAIEDALTRYYRLNGLSTWYVPGADHAGFETWVVYEKALEKIGHTRFEYTRDELYAQVWDFVAEQRGNMELQVRALGASCAWDDLTFTLDENVIDRVYTTFEKMWKDGMIYRGEKLVNYCPKHQTAFADIEVEHKDEDGMLWDIRYELAKEGASEHSLSQTSRAKSFSGEDKPSPENDRLERESEHPDSLLKRSSDARDDICCDIIVSITRPETLFGDTAVAVNPKDERYKDLVGQFVKLPLTDRVIPIIADEHADMGYGTGCVKITPAHDYDDFEVGERHGLERIRVIDDSGRMINCGPEYDGLSTLEARKKALKALREQNLLVGEKKIKHAVAHCYKCGTVIEPTLKEQWFIDVKKLAKEAIKHLKKGEIKFYPESKEKVLINYLENLKDWNISRQIPWGIAIPMFHKATEGQEGAPEWIFDRRTNLKEIEVGGMRYVRDEDTFDTWFSSSHWPIVCTDWVEGKENPYYPLNVMETAGDILFAWVARMIMMGVYVTGEVPFKEVYLHGLVLDAHGKKMSKSKGNVLNPIEMVTKYGSDAFRLGILRGRSAGLNQAFSENSVAAGRNLCNKLWNVSRYVQNIVDSSDSGAAAYDTENMGEDWICRELNECREKVARDMKEYRFSEAVETLTTTIWDKYAGWFIESQKIYKNVPLLKETLEMILVMLHPFAPFVTEAIWQNLSWTEGMVIDAKWPAEFKFDPISAEEFERLMVVVSETRRVSNELSVFSKGKKYGLLYGDDSIVDDNSLLVQKLSGAASIIPTNGQPRGIRLAVANSEVYLDAPAEVVAEYRDALTERILGVGKELNALEARMMNPNYVQKAPANLVKETEDGIKEKTALIERLKKELEVI